MSDGFEIRARRVGSPSITSLRKEWFKSARVVGRDFGAEGIQSFGSEGSRFERCRFDGLNLGNKRGSFSSFGAGLTTSEYVDCTFDNARLEPQSGGFTRFVRCSFQNVRIREWWCFDLELIDCIFSGKIETAWFNGTVRAEDVAHAGRTHNEFRGNDFSGADLVDVAFRTGIDLDQQRLPVAPHYVYIRNASETFKAVWADVITWDNLALRKDVLTMIESRQRAVDAGQRQMLLDYRNYTPSMREIGKAFIDACRAAQASNNL